MNKKVYFGLSMLLLMVVIITGFALAQKSNPRTGQPAQQIQPIHQPLHSIQPQGDRWELMANELGLDEQAAGKLYQIHRDAQRQHIRLRAELEIAQMELDDLIRSAQSNESDIRSAAMQLNKIHSQLLEQRVNNLLAAKNILTPEQYEKMVLVMDRMHRRAAPGRFMAGPPMRGQQRPMSPQQERPFRQRLHQPPHPAEQGYHDSPQPGFGRQYGERQGFGGEQFAGRGFDGQHGFRGERPRRGFERGPAFQPEFNHQSDEFESGGYYPQPLE